MKQSKLRMIPLATGIALIALSTLSVWGCEKKEPVVTTPPVTPPVTAPQPGASTGAPAKMSTMMDDTPASLPAGSVSGAPDFSSNPNAVPKK